MASVLLTTGFWEHKLITSVFDGDEDAEKEITVYCSRKQREGKMANVRCPSNDGKSYMQDKCEWREACRVEILSRKAV
jgi:hypothetical protein